MPERLPEASRVRVSSINDMGEYRDYAQAQQAMERGIRQAGGSRVATTGSTGVLSLGSAGIPGGAALPSVLATGSPLSVFQYTLSRADRLAMFRYFRDSDPYVGRAIELHSELPLSRLSIGPPKGPSSKANREINRIYESFVERVDLFRFLLDVNRDYWSVGDVFIWVEWDKKNQTIKDVFIIPAEYMHVIIHPFMRSNEIIIYARPLVDTASIRRMTDRDLYQLCLYEYTLIRMGDGTQRPIRDIRAGDVVLSGDGKLRRVLGTSSRLVDEEIVHLKTWGQDDPIRITKGHKVHTNRGRIPCEEVKEGDYLYYRPDHTEIPVSSINDDRAKLIGWFLAEGGIRSRRNENSKDRIEFSFNLEKEKEVALSVLSLLQKEFPPEEHNSKNPCPSYEELLRLNPKLSDITPSKSVLEAGYSGSCRRCGAPNHLLSKGGRVSHGPRKGEPQYQCRVCNTQQAFEESLCVARYDEDDSTNSIKVTYVNQSAVDFFTYHCGKFSSQKKMSSDCMLLPKNQQRLLLDAYFSGDGHEERTGGKRAISTSPDLRDQIYSIAARLGWNARVECRYDDDDGQGCVKFPEEDARFRTTEMFEDNLLGDKPVYKIFLSKDTLTGKNAFPVVDGNLLKKVTEVSFHHYKGIVCNICVEHDHTYHAGGVAVNNSGDPDVQSLLEEADEQLPEGLKALLDYGEGQALNTDPRKGSFCYHLARNRNTNESYGSSIIQRCIDTLLRLENLKNSQIQISGRNMAPKHLICADGISKTDLDDLRIQVDLALLDTVDYPICFRPETMIRYGNGTQRRIDQAQVGDEVISAQGNVRKIIRVMKRWVDEDICQIHANGMTDDIFITNKHKMFSLSGDVRAEEVECGDFLLGRGINEEVENPEINENRALLLGWYAAEGLVWKRDNCNSQAVHFCVDSRNPKDQEFLSVVDQLLTQEFPPEARKEVKNLLEWEEAPGKFPGRCTDSKGNVRVIYCNDAACEFFEKYAGNGSRTKILHESVVKLPSKLKRIILRAWVNGDGLVEKDHHYIVGTSTSRDLRDQMQFICMSLGIRSRPWSEQCGRMIAQSEVASMSIGEAVFQEVKHRLYITTGEATKIWNDGSSMPKGILVPKLEHDSRDRLKWTPELKAYLKAVYPYKHSRVIAEELSITYEAVRLKASRLKIRRDRRSERSMETTDGFMAMEVDKAETVHYTGFVYNIEVKEDHTYQTEGVCVHNCTNYPVTWETKGANDRLLNVETEYSMLLKILATGLSTTEEMLTGQATYSSQRFSMELMNTQYLHNRELLKTFIHRALFQPIAEAHGHYRYEKIDTWVRIDKSRVRAGDDLIQEYDGSLRKRKVIVNKRYDHSEIRWSRLSIRDNAEVYDQLFQLHQKGSLALRWLLDIHNIDSEENATALVEDVATVRDPVFNRILEGAYGALADRLANDTDLFDRIMKGLNLDIISKVQGQPSPGTPIESTQTGLGGFGGSAPLSGGGMMAGGGGEMGGEMGGETPGGEIGAPTETSAAPVGGETGGAEGGAVTSGKKRTAPEELPQWAKKRLNQNDVERIVAANQRRKEKDRKQRPRRNGHYEEGIFG